MPPERTRAAATAPATVAGAEPRRSRPPVSAARHAGAPQLRLVPHDPSPPAATPATAAAVLRSPGPGEPLRPAVAGRLQSGFGVDLTAVRVHRDGRAADAVRSLGARAFAFGRRIFLRDDAQADDVGLMAHEVAHVLQQQRGGPAVQQLGGEHGGLEREAAGTGQAIRQGQAPRVEGRAAAAVQRDEESPGFIERMVMGIVERFAPDLVPIIRQGVVAWLEDKVSSAVQTLIDTVTAPVRAATGFIGELVRHFGDLVVWMREAGGKIVQGDCSPLSEAAEKIQQVIEGLAAPVIDKVKQVADKVKGFFSDLWDRFGAPVWDFLQRVGGAVWQRIQDFAEKLWDKTQPIRDAIARAWTWFKNKLGIGEGPEGQNGLLQWVQAKLTLIWDKLKAKLEPYKKQIAIVAGVLVMLSPAGPIIAIGAVAVGLMYGIRWIARNLRNRGAVVDQRSVLERTIIPGMQSAIGAIAGALQRAAGWLVEKLSAVAGNLGNAVGMLADSILRFLVSIARFLLDRFQELATWAVEKVQGLATLVQAGLERLRAWLEPVFRVLRRIGAVIANLLEIVGLIAERAWNLIPACIRDPIVNFLTTQILSRIPIFSSLVKVPNIWGLIVQTAKDVIRQVFRDGNLMGAVMTVFRFLLKALNVPVELAKTVFAKAAGAMGKILDDPLGFLKNLLLSLKAAFAGFFRGALRYLLGGVGQWILDQLKDAKVTPPADFSLGSIFTFVLDLLGITLERVWKALAKKVGQPIVDRMRKALDVLTGAWAWVRTLIENKPGELAGNMRDKLGDLWGIVRGAIVDWLIGKLIEKVTVKLLSMLDPTGVMAVVNSIIAIWNAIESAIEYARQILEMINNFLDGIANVISGSIAAAGLMLEKLLARGLPVAIGFLAHQVGLDGLGRRLAEMVEKIRNKVGEAIDWLVEKAVNAGQAVLRALGLGDKKTPEDKPGEITLPSEEFDEEESHEHHRLYWSEGADKTLTIATGTPTPVGKLLDELTVKPADAPKLKDAKDLVVETRKLSKEIGSTKISVDTKTTKRADLQTKQDKLAQLLRTLVAGHGFAKAKEKYALEGMVGAYRALQTITGRYDDMTPDHQPQDAIVAHARDVKEGGALVFAGTAMRSYSGSDMVCINLHHHRHTAGRTYGRSPDATAVNDIDTAVTKNAGDRPKQRHAVLVMLQREARDDAKAIKDAVGRADSDAMWDDVRKIVPVATDQAQVIKDIRTEVRAGETKIVQQDFDRFA